MSKKCQCACGCERMLADDDLDDCCEICCDYCTDYNEHPEWLPNKRVEEKKT